jgi:glutamate-1-semialdehyde 2,1-aminomutase/spore coat polysaccharide biosynthesis protein SpsF
MSNPNIIVFVQARMGSGRLPGKIMAKINGKELLIHQIDRIRRAQKVNDVVVITSDKEENNVIEKLCNKNTIPIYRGSEDDLLDRHYQAAKKFSADFVVKIPGDCPLSDANIIDQVLQLWLDNRNLYDYVSNYHPATFPDGLDVEGAPLHVLEKAWQEADKTYEREHCYPYVWDHPEKFKIGNLTNSFGNMFMTHRWTLDYPEDLLFIERVYKELDDQQYFGMNEVLNLLKEKPEIANLNKKYNGVNWYRNQEGNLSTVKRSSYVKTKPHYYTESLNLLNRSKAIIPCATQTLSKGYTQWSVGAAPLFVDSASGCELTDVDGNVFIDYGMGLGPFILGYNDPDVNHAVTEQLKKGTMFTLPHSLEIKAAEAIIDLVPCAEMVRFGKNGSDATTAAIKLARAFTGKDKVIVCGYHGWHDWYIASTEREKGIPSFTKDLVISLEYNDLNQLNRIISKNKNQIAALIMEPVGTAPPKNNFLQKVRDITKNEDIVLIFDELFTGFRWGLGGAQEYFNVTPDLACFGKAIANGYPVSCIVGSRELMKLFEEVFFSFTYGGETLSLAAIVATLKKLKELPVYKHIEELGNKLKMGIIELIDKYEMQSYISIDGYPFKSVMIFNGQGEYDPLELKTYFQQECAKRGILFIGYHLVSYSHQEEDIESTLIVYNDVISALKEKIITQTLLNSLEGSVVTQIFNNVGDRSIR